MIIWRITGNEVGPNGNGAAHFATKAEALAAWRHYDPEDFSGTRPTLPEKIIVRTRAELATALDDAMGFGAS